MYQDVGSSAKKSSFIFESYSVFFVKRAKMEVEEKEETPCAVLLPLDQNFQFGPIFLEKEDRGDQNFQ